MNGVMRRRTAAGSAVFLMMYMLAVVLIAPSAARATHVEPVLIEGNEDCAAATGTTQLIKLEGADLSDGTYQVEGGTVTVVIGADGVFDWSSTVTIAAVFVKGGPDGNLYDYRPLNGATADQGLHAPDNDSSGGFYGLSHITFCEFDSPTTTTEGETTTTEGETTTTQAATTTSVSPTSVASITASVGASGKCSEAQLGKGELSVTVTPAGAATVTINGKAFTAPGAIVGVDDESTYPWSAVAQPGYVLAGPTAGSVTMPKCDVSVLGTVLESSTTVAAVSASTLPFTGFELENTLLLAGAALMSGVGLLLLTVGKEEETPTPVHNRW
jgi:hypothetical protein